MRSLPLLYAAALAVLMGGCTITDRSPNTTPLDTQAKWALLPIANHTDTPQAGLRAEAIVDGVLRARGVKSLARYPATLNPEALFEASERRVQEDARKWAREQGARYGVYGAVDEWRYKVGVDGEPAVGLALHIVDLQSDEVVFSAVGAKSGWSRDALSGVAQGLVRDLLGPVRLK